MGKLRHILKDTATRKRPDLPLLSVVREKGVIPRDIEDREENHNFIPEDLSNYKVVDVGQLAMNKMKAWQGSYGVSRFKGIVSPAYFIFDVKGVHVSFFHTAIRSKAYVPFFTQASDGVRIGQWDLSKERIREIPFFVPPLDEQQAIVRYLDRADECIQRAISAKERLVELLTEQRQAVIHQAVTRGLDPNVRLKDSGSEWLGEVPEHWNIFPLSAVAQPKTDTYQEGLELLSVYLDRGVIHFKDAGERRTNPTSEDLSNYKVVESGDFVLNNQQAWRGSVGVSKFTGVVSPAYFVLSLSEVLTLDFANLLFRDRSMVSQYLVSSRGVGTIQRNLYWPYLKQITVAVPPVSEQTKIIRRLDKATADIDTAIANAQRQIDLLREYRTRLIADVVTGQVDVRGALEDEIVLPVS